MAHANLISNRHRAHLDAITAMYAKVSGGKPIDIHTDFIRLEAVLKNGTNSYQFDPGASAIKRTLEKGVKQSNVFHAIAGGIFIDQREVGKDSRVVLYSCPNDQFFQENKNDLMSIYNGTHSYSVGTKNYIDADSNLRFFNLFGQKDFPMKYDESDFSGLLKPLEPSLAISGSEPNKFTINLASTNGLDIEPKAVEGKELENVVTIYLIGFTAENGSYLLDTKQR